MPDPGSAPKPTPDTAAILQQVGTRVRELRKAAGVPRRVLSERSGVSPRYLAQLEAGTGNISIARLAQVAAALDVAMAALFTNDDKGQVLALFEAAPPSARADALAVLRNADARAARAARICLIGLRGAGKSTLGAKAAQALGLPFVELNREIAAHAGMPIGEIMALYGGEGYRKLEGDALSRVVARHDRLILAVGGGIVAEPATFDHLLSRCHTIWLRAQPEEHMARVRAQGDERPMQGQPEAMTQLRAILAEREPLYARAHAQLDTSGQPEARSLQALLELVQQNRFLA